MLKDNMVFAPIIDFPNLKKEFQVYVDAYSVTLGVVLAQLGEGSNDHPIDFSSRKLSTVENN